MAKKIHQNVSQKQDSKIWQWLLMFVFSFFLLFLSFHYHSQLIHFRALGLFGIFLINLISSLTLFVPAPAIAFVVAGGSLYPPILVALYASLGATIGDGLGYVLGFSGAKMASLHGEWYLLLKKMFHRYGGLVVFLFAFIPNPLFDAVGIIAGVFHYSWQKFFLWLFLGRLFRNLLLAFFGVTLHTMWL